MEETNVKQELRWAAQPVRQLLHLAWPIAVSMLSVSVMTLTDTMFVGWLGASPLAGVGLGGTAVFVLMCFPWGLLGGAKVLVSQAGGAGRRKEAGPYLGAALLLASVLGLVIMGGGLAAADMLRTLSSTAESGQASVSYFALRALGIPVFLLGVAIRETRYGLGDSRSPMVASVLSNGLNIVLDYLFIFPLGMGVGGAALATVIAQVVETLVLVGVQGKDRLPVLTARWRHIRAVWQLGWPSGLQWAMETGAFSVLAVMISMFDEVQMAAHQIVLQIIHFGFLPAVAVQSAVSVLCGQSVGAGRRQLVKLVARQALMLAITYMGLFAVAMAVFGMVVVRAFTDDVAVQGAAQALIWVAVVFQVFDAANIVARGALQGTGDVRYPAVLGVVLSWVCTPPLMWLLGYRHGMGAAGGWIGLCLEIMVGAVLFWWRLERGGWHHAADRASALAGRHPSPGVASG
ncbi:MAG TPA: MATE family efflux transporter [Polyangiaceae bacterium]|nr:MATE family efflux transporter [Polyangiaceae bacterium]